MTRRLRYLARGVSLQRDGERGSAQIEFAISAVMVLSLVFMAFELCSAVYTYVVLSEAANEGVRYAIVHSSDDNLTTDTTAVITTYASYSLHDVRLVNVQVQYPDGQAVSGRVQVTVSYAYVPYVGLMKSPPTMHAYAEGRLVY